MKHIAKTALATALTLAAAAPAFAVAPITVFGKVNVSVENVNDAASNYESKIDVLSNNSRFGVKGGYGLSESLTAVYNVEWEVNVSDESASGGKSDNIKARNQYVGLEGTFGEMLVGRNDTILKQSQGKVDLFNDIRGDIKTLFKGENRTGDSLTYKTPGFGGFQAGATWVTESNGKSVDEDGEATDAFSLGAWYGDDSLKKTPIYAGVAYDSEVSGYDVARATVQGALGDFTLGGMYQMQEKVAANSEDKTGYLLSAAYSFGDFKPLIQYQDMEDLGDSASVGAEYKLGKPTKLYAFYTVRSYEKELEGADETTFDDKENYFGIGIDHKF